MTKLSYALLILSMVSNTLLANGSKSELELEAALKAPSVNINPGVEYATNTREFQGIPGIERAANGRLWATWYGGGHRECKDNYVVLVTSSDNGQTWSSEKLIKHYSGVRK